jgi:hypothetical protein
VSAGDCAPLNHFVTGPPFVRFDLAVVKRVPLVSRMTFEFRGELLNVLNNVDFFGVANASSSATMGQVTSAYRDSSAGQNQRGRSGLPSRRSIRSGARRRRHRSDD